MKNILSLILIPSAVLFASCSSEQSTDNAQLETDISPVIPKINGSIERIYVKDNQVVKEGDTILVLDDAIFNITVKQAEIAVLSAKRNTSLARSNKDVIGANINSVTANSNAVAANLNAAQAAVNASRIKFEVSDKNYQRFKTLLEQKSATQQQYDGIKAERDANEQLLKIAEGQVNALQQQIAASKSQITSTAANANPLNEGIGLAELNVKQAEANLEAAQLQLSYCVVTAPCSGVISKKNVQKGQVVSIGQPLMAITNNTKVWVVANFKETQIKNMKVGQDAEIEVEAYDKTFKGKVESFSQATGSKFSLLPADNATGNFVKVTQRIPVKIVITENNNEYPLRAGMSVEVKVKTK
jgi:membrane fusion protein (multidrug efflux system)